MATQYLSYNIELFHGDQLYSFVYALNLFPVTQMERVYQHTLEVISQRLDKLPESDGSLSLAELITLYGLSSADNDVEFVYGVKAHERGWQGMRYVVHIYPVTVLDLIGK